MKRYLNSFLITLFLYISLAFFFFFLFENKLQNEKINEKNISKKISLNQVKIENRNIKEKPKKAIVQKKEKIKPKSKPKPKYIKKEKVVKKVINNTPKINKPIVKKAKPVIATPKVDERKEFLNKHLSQIRALINQNIIYPKRAKKLNIQGIVKVRFVILKNGKLSDVFILDGHKLLKKATIKAIQSASKNFPKTTKDIEITLPIAYKLI